MTSNLHPGIAREMLNPVQQRKSESARALKRAVDRKGDAGGGSDRDPERDLAEAAERNERNDAAGETPLHGDTQ